MSGCYKLGNPTMAVPHPGDANPKSCSLHHTGWLCSPGLALKTWGIPGELLVYDLHWNPEEVGFNIRKRRVAAWTSNCRITTPGPFTITEQPEPKTGVDIPTAQPRKETRIVKSPKFH